jgi:hypothetical protein
MKIFSFRSWVPVLVMALVLGACSKELSFEEEGNVFDPTGGTSEGTLSGAPGACANILVNGVYGQGLTMDTSNRIVVDINFTKAGTYAITTDTVNGMFFAASGTVAATGISKITLYGDGVALNPGQFTLQVKFKTSVCSFVVPVYAVAQAGSGDYFPTTTNSHWTYFSSDPSAAPNDTANQRSSGVTVNRAGQSYNVFLLTVPGFPADSSFFRKSNGEYFEYADMDVAGIADDEVLGEYAFLKDNVNAGTQWFGPEANAVVSGIGLKMRLRLVLTEKNVKVLVDNKVYINTIKVQVTQQVQATPGVYSDLLTYETWFAKGIGLIRVAAPAPAYGYTVQKYTVL